MSGDNGSTLHYYRNTGTVTAPAFSEITGVTPPSISYYDELTPQFVDIDGDGDLDVALGEENQTSIFFMKNTGTATAPNLVWQTGTNSPFTAINPIAGYRAMPAFGDIDNDGDYDLIVGNSGGANSYYKNTGTHTAPVFTLETGTNSPFSSISSYSYFEPAFADIDGDGDMDLFVGTSSGLTFYRNSSSLAPATPTVTQAGGVLTSSASTGNQWYKNGVAIPGATGQTYTPTKNGTYTVKVTNGNGTSAASNGITITNLASGIVQLSSDVSVAVYPNPSKGSVSVASQTEILSVEVVNTLGETILVQQINSDNATIDLSAASNGIYYIKVITEKETTSKQITLSH